MTHFYQSAFMEALGWSLVDSVWKMGSLWIVYVIITGNQRWHTAKVRYVLSLFLMTAGTLWSFSNLSSYYQDVIAGKEISALPFHFNLNLAITGQLMPCISCAYIATVLFFSVRLFYKYYAGRNALSKDLHEPVACVNDVFVRLAKTIMARRKVAIFISAISETPLTIGFLKPMVLLPVAAINQLTIEQTESIIAHELFHIRRNDYLANILVCYAGLLLFFNPFAKLFQGIIHRERENACDDEVMALGYDHWQYAHALYTLGKQHPSPSSFAMAATGNGQLLLERITRILRVSNGKPANMFPVALVSRLMLFFLCLSLALFLKTPKRPDAKGETVVLPLTDKMRLAYEEPAPHDKRLPGMALVRPSGRIDRTRPKATAGIKSTAHFFGASRPHLLPTPPSLPDELVASFASSKSETRDFTLTVPETSKPPEAAILPDATVPYVPSFTFYYSDTQKSLQTPVKKVVHL